MTEKELQVILQEGEGYRIEFKEGLSGLDKELVAFANASGGRVFLGIDDDRRIPGITIDNRLRSQIQDIANNCQPAIKVHFEEFKDILIISVREGDDKPYKCSSGFFLRVGPNSQKLNRDEIVAFIKAEGKVRFDELTCTKFDFKRHFDSKKLERFLRLAGITTSLDVGLMLENLGAAERQEGKLIVNNTGALFFSKNLDELYPHATVTCALYRGTEKVDILDRKDFNEDLLSSIDQAMIFLKRHLPVRYEITGAPRRKEVLEIPEGALREAVINAVAHRDYFERGANVMVEIYDDRVEITNPGGLVKGLKPEDFGKKSVLRNPNIASLLHRVDYIEKMGTGIGRMRDTLRRAKLPPPKFEFDTFFTVTMRRPVRKIVVPVGDVVVDAIHDAIREGVLDAVDDAVVVGIREGIREGNSESVQRRLVLELLYLFQKGGVTTNLLQKMFAISDATAERDLALLKRRRYVVFQGTKRRGKYVLTAKGKRLFMSS
jgi:ATP-dependent DNA helicase RecG